MKRFLIFFVLLTCLTLSANAKETYNDIEQKAIDSWVGENINNVIDAWGYPLDTKVVANRPLYYWIDYTYTSETIAPCYRILETDKDNNIIRGEWQGFCNYRNKYVKGYANPRNNPWEKTAK